MDCSATQDLNRYEHRQSMPPSIAYTEQVAQDRMRVLKTVDALLSRADVWLGDQCWNFEIVIDEVINHGLFESALRATLDGNHKPMKDLVTRTAKQIACRIHQIDPDEIGMNV